MPIRAIINYQHPYYTNPGNSTCRDVCYEGGMAWRLYGASPGSGCLCRPLCWKKIRLLWSVQVIQTVREAQVEMISLRFDCVFKTNGTGSSLDSKSCEIHSCRVSRSAHKLEAKDILLPANAYTWKKYQDSDHRD